MAKIYFKGVTDLPYLLIGSFERKFYFQCPNFTPSGSQNILSQHYMASLSGNWSSVPHSFPGMDSYFEAKKAYIWPCQHFVWQSFLSFPHLSVNFWAINAPQTHASSTMRKFIQFCVVNCHYFAILRSVWQTWKDSFGYSFQTSQAAFSFPQFQTIPTYFPSHSILIHYLILGLLSRLQLLSPSPIPPTNCACRAKFDCLLKVATWFALDPMPSLIFSPFTNLIHQFKLHHNYFTAPCVWWLTTASCFRATFPPKKQLCPLRLDESPYFDFPKLTQSTCCGLPVRVLSHSNPPQYLLHQFHFFAD